MSIEPGSLEHISQLISHVVAPAFLLGAVGSFISLLSDRLIAVVNRIRDINTTGEPPQVSGHGESPLHRLRRRAKLINLAILLAIIGGIAAVLLIVGTFAAALSGFHHVWIAAALFMVSGFFLLASLVTFALDVRLGMTAHDLH